MLRPTTSQLDARLERDQLKRELKDMERLADLYYRQLCQLKSERDLRRQRADLDSPQLD